MKKIYSAIIALLLVASSAKSQNVLYLETFSTSLNSCVATNSSSGNWIWTNSCSYNSAVGHSTLGCALFQGSSCQFGNGASTVSGDLSTPTIALPAQVCTLTFNYFIMNECSGFSSLCSYDVLKMGISTNGGSTYTDLMDNGYTYGGLASNNSGWVTMSLSLASYSSTTIKIRFNFNSIDGIGNAYDGIYVDDIKIINPCSFTLSAVSGGNTVSPGICAGANLTLTASSNAVSGYSWSTSQTTSSIVVNPTSTTTLSLSAMTHQNCVTNAAITVTVSQGTPVLSIVSSTNAVCLGKSATLTASGANSYSWTGGVTNGVSFVPSSTTIYTVTGTNGCGNSTATTAIAVAPLAVSIVASPTIVCAGTQALITVSAAATSFSWQPINAVVSSNSLYVSPTVNTIYSLTAGDGTCSGSGTVAVTTKPNPTISVSASQTMVCEGTPVSLTATGGMSYTWTANNTTISGNTAAQTVTPTSPTGFNVVGINSVGCLANVNIAVITISSPTVVVSANTNLICPADNVTISVSGANSYLWSTGATINSIVVSPLVATVYTVAGTSNSCTSTQSVNVDVFTPSVTITGSTSICTGKGTLLTASGASTYTWVNGPQQSTYSVSPTVSTIYTLSTLSTSSGINCPDTKTIQVSILPNPSLISSATRTVMCKNETNTISVSGASTYSWSTGVTVASFVFTPSLVATNNFVVTGIASNGCQSTNTVSVKVNGCVGLNEIIANQNYFNVYPNPNNGECIIESNDETQLIVFNQLGQIIRTLSLTEKNNFKIKLEGLSSGLYFVKEQNTISSKVLKVVVTD